MNTDTDTYSLEVAMASALADLSDLDERGYLVWHPDYVAHRFDLIDNMVNRLRQAVAYERAHKDWGRLDAAEPEAEHRELVAEYASHTCHCGWCRRAVLDYDPDGPIPAGALTFTEEQAVALGWAQPGS